MCLFCVCEPTLKRREAEREREDRFLATSPQCCRAIRLMLTWQHDCRACKVLCRCRLSISPPLFLLVFFLLDILFYSLSLHPFLFSFFLNPSLLKFPLVCLKVCVCAHMTTRPVACVMFSQLLLTRSQHTSLGSMVVDSSCKAPEMNT